jgi:hypothetical protein
MEEWIDSTIHVEIDSTVYIGSTVSLETDGTVWT